MIPECFDAGAAEVLLEWFDKNGVAYPWGDTPDPWGVWVSEVMLQQTTVGAVRDRYRRWLDRFPAPADLAAASEDEVLREWEGLGYYNRARNLASAAGEVLRNYGGRIPDDPEHLMRLPGVGRYIAAAVASLAYGRRTAAIDANGRRIAQRLSNTVKWSGDLGSGFSHRIESLMPESNPGRLNLALMQLGQLVCRPKNPDCGTCPLSACCEARRAGTQNDVPERTRVEAVRLETQLVLLLRGDTVRVVRRESGIGRGLWFFPRIDEVDDLDTCWTVRGGLKPRVHAYTRYRETLRPVLYRPRGAAADCTGAGECRVSFNGLSALPMPGVYRRIAEDLRRAEAHTENEQ